MAISTNAITKSKKSAKDWHRADIVCTLWKLGTSLQRLSRENHYAFNGISNALNRPWPKAERIIAKAIGVKPHQIWPSRYREDGTPKSKRGERGLGRYKTKHSTGNAAVNVQMTRAA